MHHAWQTKLKFAFKNGELIYTSGLCTYSQKTIIKKYMMDDHKYSQETKLTNKSVNILILTRGGGGAN